MGFTGIVEETGKITKLQKDVPGTWAPLCLRATIEAKVVLDGAYIGCSIAVEGVCLTVVSFTKTSFDVDIAPETLQKTHFSHKRTQCS